MKQPTVHQPPTPKHTPGRRMFKKSTWTPPSPPSSISSQDTVIEKHTDVGDSVTIKRRKHSHGYVMVNYEEPGSQLPSTRANKKLYGTLADLNDTSLLRGCLKAKSEGNEENIFVDDRVFAKTTIVGEVTVVEEETFTESQTITPSPTWKDTPAVDRPVLAATPMSESPTLKDTPLLDLPMLDSPTMEDTTRVESLSVQFPKVEMPKLPTLATPRPNNWFPNDIYCGWRNCTFHSDDIKELTTRIIGAHLGVQDAGTYKCEWCPSYCKTLFSVSSKLYDHILTTHLATSNSHLEDANNPEDEQSIDYCAKLGVKENMLDGDSRVCPETGETWWADMPPYFLFGETDFMADVESRRLEEDLENGKHDLSGELGLKSKGLVKKSVGATFDSDVDGYEFNDEMEYERVKESKSDDDVQNEHEIDANTGIATLVRDDVDDFSTSSVERETCSINTSKSAQYSIRATATASKPDEETGEETKEAEKTPAANNKRRSDTWSWLLQFSLFPYSTRDTHASAVRGEIDTPSKNEKENNGGRKRKREGNHDDSYSHSRKLRPKMTG